MESGFAKTGPFGGTGGGHAAREQVSDLFRMAVRDMRVAMIATDPSQPDHPIVFVNPAFTSLTGYRAEEAIGRNPRFLQGPDTNPDEVARIRACMAREQDVQLDIMNYRRDGAPFWNALSISPVRNEHGKVVAYFGCQVDVTTRKKNELRLERINAAVAAANRLLQSEIGQHARDLMRTIGQKSKLLHDFDHRVKSNLQLTLSLLSLELRQDLSDETRARLEKVRERVQALATVHRRFTNKGGEGGFDLATFIRDLAHDLAAKAGRNDVRFELDLEPVEVPAAEAAPMALVLNELVSCALENAHREQRDRLRITVKRRSSALLFEITDDHFTTAEKEAFRGGVAGIILQALARQLGAIIEWREGDARVLVCVVMRGFGSGGR